MIARLAIAEESITSETVYLEGSRSQQGIDSGKRARMATIDVDKLRDYMTDYFGTAMFNGFPAAVLDLSDIERMSGHELCQKAESLGIDLRNFEIGWLNPLE